MKIIIAGGTGFIGQAFVRHFLQKNCQCVVIGRSAAKIKKIFGKDVKAVTWKQLKTEGLHEIKTTNAIINVTGDNIGAKRWSTKRKNDLIASRITPTRTLSELCAMLGKNSPPLFNAGGVGIYGLQSTTLSGLPPAINEQQSLNYDKPTFLERIGQEWEFATEPAKVAGVHVVNMRFGVVLSESGGALKQLKLPFILFIGGPIGSGKQPFSWVALSDLVRAVDFLIEHPEISGAVNIVAPQCVTQKEFAKAFGKVLHRPSFITTPAFVLKLLYGQMADELLLNGQHVIPKVLLDSGFKFQFPKIQTALKNA